MKNAPYIPRPPRWPGAQRVLAQRHPDDPRYAVVITRRVQAFGRHCGVGDTLFVPDLADVLRLVRSGHARPADPRTARDVELAALVQQAVPREAPR